MKQRPSNDELETLGLIIICKNCNSANIKEIEGETSESLDMCGSCGTIEFTTTVTEEEYVEIQKRDVI